MKKTWITKYTAVLLTVVMLFTSNYLILHAFSAEEPVGVGINNNLMTSDNDADSKYIIQFYSHDEDGTRNLVTFPSDMEIVNSIYMAPDTLTDANDSAVIHLKKNNQIDFRQSPAFCTFVKNNRVDEIVINYEVATLDMKETSVLYSEQTQSYEFFYLAEIPDPNYPTTPTDDPEATVPMIQVMRSLLDYSQSNPFSDLTETPHLKRYDSTTMTEFTVEQDWRDRGIERPEINEVHFDIKQGDNLYLDYDNAVQNQTTTLYEYTLTNPSIPTESYTAYLKEEVSDSNTYLYKYTVPEYAPNGSKYNYSSEYNTSSKLFDEGMEEKYKTVEPTAEKPNAYMAIGLTELVCTIGFADKYLVDKGLTAGRPVINQKFIFDYSDLYKKGDGADEKIPTPEDLPDNFSKYFNITTDPVTGETILTIKRLEEISPDGNAITYYLQPKTFGEHYPITLPEGYDESGASSNYPEDFEHDYYTLRGENTGIHTNEIDKIYDGGEMLFTLTGETSFEATVAWDDKEHEAERIAEGTNAADFSLWRFVGGPENHDESALVEDHIKLDDNGQQNRVSVNNIAKYDVNGDLYCYYAVEHVSINGLPYQITYSASEHGETSTETLYGKGTVTNKLSDTAQYTVDAEWVASARQGGTATATYVLERRQKDANGNYGEWAQVPPVTVDGVEQNYSLTVNFNEIQMSRSGSSGDEACKFPVVDIYDENGYLYEYRVVQTSVSRTDVMQRERQNDPGTYDYVTTTNTNTDHIGENVEDHEETADILVNDRYHVVLTENGTNFRFQYNIEGDTYVNIEKKWVDGDTPIDTSGGGFSVTFDVQNYDSENLEYTNFFYEDEFPERYFDSYISSGFYKRVQDGQRTKIVFDSDRAQLSGPWTLDNIAVPKYDKEGREISYRAVELSREYPQTDPQGNPLGFYTTYNWRISYTDNPDQTVTTYYNYTATNHKTYSDDSHHEIGIYKEWADDGELEYRKPVRIVATGDVDPTQNPNGQIRDLTQDNVWSDRLWVMNDYEKIEDDQFVNYRPEHFTERSVEDGSSYWSKADIDQMISDHDLDPNHALRDDEEEWICQLLSGKKWGTTDYSGENASLLNADNSVDLATSNKISFDEFAGIYKSSPIDGDPKRCHYYAVRQVFDTNAVNNTVGTLHFINTRIGVISYEVKFDWKVGDALTRTDDPINSVTIRITGDGLPAGGITRKIEPKNLVDLGNGQYAYYILNLPKYDDKGKLIQYKIEELKINDQTVGTSGTVQVGSDRCRFAVSSETITEGAEGKTDDLHTIVITNTFEDNTSVTVHKQWVDDSNNEHTRPDLFIKLYRISKAQDYDNSSSTYTPEKLGNEYEWIRHADDTINYWSYTFAGYPKYDENGYAYTYYVVEQDHMHGYKQEYGNIQNNPDVHIDPTAHNKTSPQNVAYNGGTITNRLYGEVTVSGEKLWQNISSLLQREHYPIAEVTLYRDLADIKTAYEALSTPEEKATFLTKNNLTEAQVLAGKVAVSGVTRIFNGETSFKFQSAADGAVAQDLVISDDGINAKLDSQNNLLVPKYDATGKRNKYTMSEVSINGYVSRIETGTNKLINEYKGGRRLNITVNKQWDGMEGQQNYPTVKFILHQVFQVGSGNDIQYIESNTFEREIKNGSPSSVTFNEDAIRYYSLVGTPYIYVVTEILSNYDGERAIFVDADQRKYIQNFLTTHYNNDEVIELVSSSAGEKKNGEALGFNASVEDEMTDDEVIGLARQKAEQALQSDSGYDPNDTSALEAQVNKELNDNTATALEPNETIKNTYQPDHSNFQGMLEVAKTWATQKDHNSANSEYDSIRAYTVTLSRKTKLSSSQTLFKLTTTDSNSPAGSVPTFSELAQGIITDASQTGGTISVEGNPVSAHGFEPSTSYDPANPYTVTTPETGEKPNYYIAVLIKDGEALSVAVKVGENGSLTYENTIYFNGFAIYGHDALKFYYTVTEDSKAGYTATSGSGTEQLVNLKNKEISLSNRLDVFDFKLYKTFGKEYQDTNGAYYVEPIESADFPQFFNNAYVEQLRFDLWRKTESNPNPSTPYKTVTGQQILAQQNSLDSEKNAYYYTFKDLPLTDTQGNTYTYWIDELDGARTTTDSKVDVVYDDDLQTGRIAKNAVHQGYDEFTPTKNNAGTTRETFVQNIFKAKKININKYWLDNNNEDGMRPDELDVVIHEHVPNGNETIEVPFYRILKKEHEIEEEEGQSSTSVPGWTMEAALARYYFNGNQVLNNLTYDINEGSFIDDGNGNLSFSESVPTGYTRVDSAGTYPIADVYDPNTYSVSNDSSLNPDAPVSDITPKPIGNDDNATGNQTFSSLNLTNYKTPQKGTITLDKAFSGDALFKKDTRPDNLYFKLQYQDANGDFVDFTGYDIPVGVRIGNSGVTVPTYRRVIVVPLDDQTTDASDNILYQYPQVTVSGLPIGSSTGADKQTNGTFVPTVYRFVECDDNGDELPSTFPYTWDGGQKGSASNGVYDANSKTVTLDSSTDNYSKAFEITNTLKVEDHIVKKAWVNDDSNDVPNYYKTRPDSFIVRLERTTDTTADPIVWETVKDDISLKTNKSSLSSSSDPYPDNYTYNSDPTMAKADFRDLPVYDKDGNKYYYRVVETYIGPTKEDKYEIKTRHLNHDYYGTNVYYVIYDSDIASDQAEALTDNQTFFSNNMITITEYYSFFAQKDWQDTYNQDYKRPDSITAVLKQSKTVNGEEIITTYPQELNPENSWIQMWLNFPYSDADGNLYTYEVYEEIPESSASDYQYDSANSSDQIFRFGDVTFREQILANAHTQDKRDLTVQKQWTGENNDADNKKLRPDSITYELYCKYPKYKYNSNDEIVSDGEYDGPISESPDYMELLYKHYRETDGWTLDMIPNKTYSEYIQELTDQGYFTNNFVKTVTPDDGDDLTTDDRTNDALWTSVTFEDLPVNINTAGDDIRKGYSVPIQYYVKEIAPTFASDKENPYTYGVGGYGGDGNGNTPLTTLYNAAGTASENKTVTATNELKTRDIPVTKVWNDSGYTDKSLKDLHYAIDFTLTCAQTASGYSYNETRTLAKDSTPDRVTFTNLPKYDKDGSLLSYTVSEKVSGENVENRYGYVKTVSSTTDSNGILNSYTITNTLPVIRFRADKVWADNKNQDGVRPAELNFTLSGVSANDSQDTVAKTLSDGSSHYTVSSTEDRWSVDFGVQPKYDLSNVVYDYTVYERADGLTTYTPYNAHTRAALSTDVNTGYSINDDDSVVTTATAVLPETKTFRFRNVYEPLKKNLTVNKSWDDTVREKDFSSWTRPTSVFVELYYQYPGSAKVRLSTAGEQDPVKKLILAENSGSYSFQNEIKTSESWTNTFVNLPLYVNPTGTEVYNGEKKVITYYVEETPLNGYTRTDTDSATLESDQSITVANKLKTTVVTVQKVWKDGYAGDQAEHYDVHLTLSNMNPNLDGAQNTTLTGTIVTTPSTINTSTVDTATEAYEFEVPQYIMNGTAATYRVSEDTTDKKYGYVTTYSGNEFGSTPSATHSVTVFNTLPLTEISVTKHWDDEQNKYGLRPGSISVQLQRRTVINETTGAAWASDSEGWADFGDKVTVNGDMTADSWTKTITQLPRYNVNNVEYEYRVVEDEVKAYDTDYDATNVTFNGENSNVSCNVTNELIKAPLKLIKIWNDNGYTGSDYAHYTVSYRIAKPANVDFTFRHGSNDYIDVAIEESNKDNALTSSNSHETWAKDSDAYPVYDKNGNPIQYTVTEVSGQHYGYQAASTVITRDGVHTGYTGNNYYDSYSITNELPLTQVTAVKHWEGNLEKYPNDDVTVNLSRSAGSTADSFSQSGTVTYAAGDPDDTYTFTDLLAYDYNNTAYSFTITEPTVRGYSTAYSQNNGTVTVQSDPKTITVTNTPKKGQADFVKYDVTDLDKHGLEQNFKLITLPGAQFELHRVKEDAAQPDKILYVTGSNGTYAVSDTQTNVVIESGANGEISLSNLEPNKYYLKELAVSQSDANGGAPEGYQYNGAEFRFEVDADSNNQIVVTYTQQSVTNNSALKLDNAAFSVDSAKTSLNDLSGLQCVNKSQLPSTHGIPNEENLSHLTLTKVDRNNQTDPLRYATYFLLRLYNFEYRKTDLSLTDTPENRAQYLQNALNAVSEDYSSQSDLWKYWEKIETDSTDSDGKITIVGNMFGTYIFYEVKAPVGFERDFTHNDTTASPNTNAVGPVELSYNNASHEVEVHNLTHLEPRKNAQIKVLKTDENGNPLRAATFDLYLENQVPGTDSPLTTLATGYDGMNANAFVIDTTAYQWGQKFFFIETTPPTGYAPHNDDPNGTKIEFTLTRELADETLHIVRANDIRLKGKIDLTKTSSGESATVQIGDPLSGAKFRLYSKADTTAQEPLTLHPHNTNSSDYIVTGGVEHDPNYNYSVYSDYLITGSDGKLHIEDIEWGDYYLKEIEAPVGFELPTGEDAKVYFSVGRNNCAQTQELGMENEPLRSRLNILKHIDQKNESAWGKPTFIFKIEQTRIYNHQTQTFDDPPSGVTLPTLTKTIIPETVNNGGGFDGQTGLFDIEPGTYRITEVRVARYTASADSATSGSELITDDQTLNTPTTAVFSVKPNGAVEVRFSNELRNYEKLSHIDGKTNSFNGYKAIEANDYFVTPVHTPASVNESITFTIDKSALLPKLIKSDGTAVSITDLSKLIITKPAGETEIVIADNGQNTFTVSGRREDLSSSVYKLTATYAGMFSDDFELRFAADPLFSKNEKTVYFYNDIENKSHFDVTDNGVYALTFIINDTPTNTVVKILHDGVATGKTDKTAFPSLSIDDIYADEKVFDKWQYTIGGVTYDAANDDALFAAIVAAANDADITVRAVLKDKPPQP